MGNEGEKKGSFKPNITKKEHDSSSLHRRRIVPGEGNTVDVGGPLENIEYICISKKLENCSNCSEKCPFNTSQ